MKKTLLACVVALGVASFVVSNAWADGCGKTKATAHSKSGCASMSKVAMTGGKAGCADKCTKGAAACIGACGTSMASMPTMSFIVDGKETQCCQTARHAAANGKNVQYVVSMTYANKEDAVKTLTAGYHNMIDDMLTVRTVVGDQAYQCPMEAKQASTKADATVRYAALGQKFDCPDKANTAVARAKAAVEQVAMTYKVDGQEIKCSKTAGKCSKEGKKVEYVVGNHHTACPVEAEMLVARAKLAAIVNSTNGTPAEKNMEKTEQTASIY